MKKKAIWKKSFNKKVFQQIYEPIFELVLRSFRDPLVSIQKSSTSILSRLNQLTPSSKQIYAYHILTIQKRQVGRLFFTVFVWIILNNTRYCYEC